MLLEPQVVDNEGLDPVKMQQGMKKEIDSMKAQSVFTEVSYNDIPQEHRNNIIESRCVHKQKDNEVHSRIVAKGFTEKVQDPDTIYASTPIFGILRTLLTIALMKQWIVRVGDISVAFLHALAASDNLYMWPYQACTRAGTTLQQSGSSRKHYTAFAAALRHVKISLLTYYNIYISQDWSANQMPSQTKSEQCSYLCTLTTYYSWESHREWMLSSKQYNNLYYYGTQAHSESDKQSTSLAGKSQTMVITTKSR